MTLLKTFIYVITIIVIITLTTTFAYNKYVENENIKLENERNAKKYALHLEEVALQSQKEFIKFIDFINTIPTTISLETANSITNNSLDQLRTNISEEVKDLNKTFNPNKEKAPQLDLTFYVSGAAEVFFDEKTVKVKDLLVSYDEELKKETTLREEQARIQAEQAAAEAEAENQRVLDAKKRSIIAAQQIQNTDVNTSNESVEVRIARLQAETGITIPVYLQEACGSAPTTPGYYIIACYQPVLHYISITQAGYNLSDASVKCSLLHENRHYWQDINGYIQVDSAGNILNRDWLEADAKANSCST